LILTSGRREVLLGIVANSKNLTVGRFMLFLLLEYQPIHVRLKLPDFLEALEIHNGNLLHKDVDRDSETQSLQGSGVLSRTSGREASSSKTWYQTHDTPKACLSLRTDSPSTPQSMELISTCSPGSLGLGSLPDAGATAFNGMNVITKVWCFMYVCFRIRSSNKLIRND